MKRYYEQETPYSCGASAIRNVLKQFNIIKSEKHLRKLCHTNETGTSQKAIIKTLQSFNLTVKEIQTKSEQRFKRIIKTGLINNNKFILLVDNTQHYITAISYYNNKVKIIDSDFIVKRKLSPELTMQQLINMSFNYDKIKNQKYFYIIQIIQF